MPESKDNLDARQSSTDLAIPEAIEEDNTSVLRRQFNKAIGMADDAVWQPMLRRLEQFQQREKEAEVGAVRGKLREFFNSDTYNSVDKWLLTYFSIFGPHALEFLAAKTGVYVDESTKQAFFEYLSSGLAIGFAADTVGNTVAHGTSYWANVSDRPKEDGSDPDRKEINWEPAPIINVASMAGSLSAVDLDNVRIARLLKMARLSKVARLAKLTSIHNSLEDEGAKAISADFTRLIVIFTAAVAALTTAADFDYTRWQDLATEFAALGVLIYAIQKHQQQIRTQIANVFTRRFRQADERILNSFSQNPQLSFMGTLYREGGNEIDQFEDRIIGLNKITQELSNPLGEELEIDEEGHLVTKFIDRTVVFTDLRNWTLLNAHHPPEETEPLMAEYFSDMYPIVSKHGGCFANMTGDGALIFFKDGEDDQGNAKSSRERGVECAIELGIFSARYDRIIRERLPIDVEGVDHKTGVGMNTGTIAVGDLFRKREVGGIRKPETLGTTANTAARVESLHKQFPGHTLLVTEAEYDAIPETLQGLFEHCGSAHMKGIGEMDIWGIPEELTLPMAAE